MMLTMMMNTPASAGNLSYNYSGADGGNFGKPTSTEPVTVVDGDAVNVDISKNSAFIPPLFGSPEADVLGMGELLTPDISGVEPMFPHSTQAGFAPGVTENGAETGGGPIVLPPDAAGSEVSGAPIYDSTPSGNTGDYTGGFTGGGADAAIGSGYTPVDGMHYKDGSIGTLSIPSIGVNRKVYDGETVQNMRLGVAHFEGTSAWDGNVAMSAHNRGSYGYFSRIHELKAGDTITYSTVHGTRSYQVYSVRKISKYEIDVLDPANENMMTLITCVRDQAHTYRWCVQAAAV
ncbi:MAG: sortase [Agathobaculum desmolans]|uniref:sortase n=1 Tax=Agathobaculum desmolans TaxID=39484 RepID=UPI003995E41D